MIDIDQLRATERESEYRYPASFWSIVDQLQAVAIEPSFANVFGEVRTASSQDIREAYELGLDESVVPFMCDRRGEDIDYYCVGSDSPEIVVSATHAIVWDWPNFAAFIAWVRQRCEIAQQGRA